MKMTEGARRIAAERQRQIEVEGWTSDQYELGCDLYGRLLSEE